jgi:hypothetical protein
MIYRLEIVFVDRCRNYFTLLICDTMFDLVVVVGIRKHERKSYSTGKSELLFVSDLG